MHGYEIEVETSEDVDRKTDWMSSFYFMPKSSTFKYVVEKYEYGISELQADFGSYLFLGWSLLTITEYIPVVLGWLKDIFKTMTHEYKAENTQ